MSAGSDGKLVWMLEAVDGPAMRVWAEMLRDDNPIHLDADAAALLGFGHRTLNQGPANLAFIMNMLLEAGHGDEIAEVSAQFLGNVVSGDAVVAMGELDKDAPCLYRTRLVRSNAETVVTADILLTPEKT